MCSSRARRLVNRQIPNCRLPIFVRKSVWKYPPRAWLRKRGLAGAAGVNPDGKRGSRNTRKTSTRCRLNAGPASQTLPQHCIGMSSTFVGFTGMTGVLIHLLLIIGKRAVSRHVGEYPAEHLNKCWLDGRLTSANVDPASSHHLCSVRVVSQPHWPDSCCDRLIYGNLFLTRQANKNPSQTHDHLPKRLVLCWADLIDISAHWADVGSTPLILGEVL